LLQAQNEFDDQVNVDAVFFYPPRGVGKYYIESVELGSVSFSPPQGFPDFHTSAGDPEGLDGHGLSLAVMASLSMINSPQQFSRERIPGPNYTFMRKLGAAFRGQRFAVLATTKIVLQIGAPVAPTELPASPRNCMLESAAAFCARTPQASLVRASRSRS
jgi:hypothetical protein